MVRLADVADKIDYGVTASATSEKVGPRFLRITDIQDGAVDWNSVPFCAAPAKKLDAAVLNDGDIVFARTGATTGKSFRVSKPPEAAVFASYLIRVRPSQRIDSRYLSHFFRTKDYWNQIASKSQGAAQEGVNASKLADLSIPLPPLDEQRRIAAILDKADALRQKRKRAIALLDSLTQSIFREMFGDMVVNSRSWPVQSLDELCSRITVGIVVKPASYYQGAGVPALRSLNIEIEGFNLTDLVYLSHEDNEGRLAKTRVFQNDVVIVRTGQPGKAAVVPRDLDGANAVDLLIATPCAAALDAQFLSTLLNSPIGKRLVMSESRGQIQQHLNVGSLKAARIPIPPIAVQQEFARIWRMMREQLDASTRHQRAVDHLFASLQHRAFSGQL